VSLKHGELKQPLKQASVEQLVAIVQVSGDSAAFNELFGRFERKLRAFLLYKSADSKFEVDDLVQETFVKAFLNIGQYSQQAQFSTWLLRIAINELLQAKRAQGIFSRLKQRWFSNEPEARVHNDHIAEQRDAAMLLATLSEVQQQVFVCAEYYGYSQSEIADKLQLPLGSVKTYMKQARDALDRINT
jgi:RNA polymerase sigma-70 factor (ECF subfamily)